MNDQIFSGTTPTFLFKTTFDKQLIKKLKVVFKAKDTSVYIEKTENDCRVEPEGIYVTLSQLDTLELAASSTVQIQLRVLTNTNPEKAFATNIFRVRISNLLKNEVI